MIFKKKDPKNNKNIVKIALKSAHNADLPAQSADFTFLHCLHNFAILVL